MSDRDAYKQQAAKAAVELIQPGMILGLGHGSTAKFAIEAVGYKIKKGEIHDVVAVPCSKQTESDMKRLGIPIVDLNSIPRIDLTIDGADEVDPELNLIKGGGGAVLREKIVAQVSKRYVIIVDEEKLSPALGTKFFVPLEILPFGWERQSDYLKSIGGYPALRKDKSGQPVLSDQGNYLLDCKFGPISDLRKLAKQLESRSGILEHGLFLNLATDVIAAGPKGIQHLTAKR
jgi:ribose 5-phosphate isomerase A